MMPEKAKASNADGAAGVDPNNEENNERNGDAAPPSAEAIAGAWEEIYDESQKRNYYFNDILKNRCGKSRRASSPSRRRRRRTTRRTGPWTRLPGSTAPRRPGA